MQPLWLYTARLPQGAGSGYRIPGLTRSVQTGLRYTWTPDADWVVRSEIAYQWLYKAPVAAGSASAFSMLNVSEITLSDSLRAAGNGENASFEVSLERYFDGNWFLLLNGTLIRARYRGSDQVWRDSRWDFQNMINLSAGKEWQRSRRAGKIRAFGLNARLTSRGGFRAMPVDQAASAAARTTVFDAANGFSQQLPAFFRTDARVYWRRHTGNRRNSTLALEIQNVTANQNVAYFYYDPFLKQVETKYQLGLLPNLSWRLEF
jgi:hypothetical protein